MWSQQLYYNVWCCLSLIFLPIGSACTDAIQYFHGSRHSNDGSQPQKFRRWNLKLAHPGGQGETKKNRYCRLVVGRCSKHANTPLQACPGSAGRWTHLPIRILKVYGKILVELRHRQCGRSHSDLSTIPELSAPRGDSGQSGRPRLRKGWEAPASTRNSGVNWGPHPCL